MVGTARSRTRVRPTSGWVVPCRSHRWLVEEVEPAAHPKDDAVVRLACLDDDANGQQLKVFWQRAGDARVLGEIASDTLGPCGFIDVKPDQLEPLHRSG